jgi:Tol biopolymer transport system component
MIAFWSLEDSASSIKVVRVSDGSTTVVTGSSSAVRATPGWSPDGVNVAFSCDLGGFCHIWVINTAGSGLAAAGSGY